MVLPEQNPTGRLEGPFRQGEGKKSSVAPFIRSASVGDIAAISGLIQNNFHSHPAYASMDDNVRADYLRANSPDALTETLAKPGTHFTVSELYGVIAAVIVVREKAQDALIQRLVPFNRGYPPEGVVPNGAIDIRRLHTARGYEGGGLAGQLLLYAEELAKSQGRMLLISDVTGPAQGYFMKNGFYGVIIPKGRQNGSSADVFRCVKIIGQ